MLFQAAFVRYHGTKMLKINNVFLFFPSFCLRYFLPRRGYHRVLKLCMRFNSQTKQILGEKKLGCPPFFFEKTPEMARKLKFLKIPHRQVQQIISAGVDGGLRDVSVKTYPVLKKI